MGHRGRTSADQEPPSIQEFLKGSSALHQDCESFGGDALAAETVSYDAPGVAGSSVVSYLAEKLGALGRVCPGQSSVAHRERCHRGHHSGIGGGVPVLCPPSQQHGTVKRV